VILCLAAVPALVCAPRSEAGDIRVGIHEKAPYATRDAEGRWDGLAVALWEDIARANNYTFRYVERPLEQLLPALRDGGLDIVMGEIAVEPFYEKQIDFSQPFLASSLGIAVPAARWKPDWMAIARSLFNWSLIELLAVIVVGLVVVSVLVWIFERHRSGTHFPKRPLHGLGAALWFSTGTMTAVGYGDKTPASVGGRIVAAIWMVAGTLIVAAFTGAVASAVTAARADASGSFDFLRLSRLRNGVLAGSTSEEILRLGRCPLVPFETTSGGLAALGRGEIDTFIADRISLSYVSTHHNLPGIRILPDRFSSFTIAFGLPTGSPLRENINLALLETIHSPEWAKTVARWLGPAHKDTPASLPELE